MNFKTFILILAPHRAIVLCLISMYAYQSAALAQDVHFSQMGQTPLLLNPALTGVFNGKYRAFINYKDQWSSFGKAYRTSAFSIDTELMKNPKKRSSFGAGLIAFSDRAGDFGLSTAFVGFSFSGIVKVAVNQVVTGGIRGGFGQRSVNIQNPRTSEQFVGSYDPSLSSGESFQFDPFHYGNFSLGIGWSKWRVGINSASNVETRTSFGLAYHHVNRPKVSFNLIEEQLYSKIILHGHTYFRIKNAPLGLLPAASVVKQGPATEINVGTYLRYRVREDSRYTGLIKESTVLLGLHTRIGDALIPSIMLVIADYTLGISYDINISSLRKASSGRGGIEFSLRFQNVESSSRGKKGRAKHGSMY
ncbi:MAG: PorP/SprF family type IX secretion system membrane protein [Flavobacteriales bacterium]|nr:PorP/SprF family type IX secretion system membrane protein [Flavobacteriales bacterium]